MKNHYAIVLLLLFANSAYSESYISHNLDIQIMKLEGWDYKEIPQRLTIKNDAYGAVCSLYIKFIPDFVTFTKDQLKDLTEGVFLKYQVD